ncbi:MAG TPA: glycosyltransferase family 4 protein [Longimicrobiales bacterium]|nr:glycosyltransferase family 4 protein [Longimicrobiales bacterium]
MRILVVNWMDRENPQAGGAEIHLHETFGRLAARGHAVTLLCSGWPEGAARDRLDGIEVHRVGGRYSFPLHAPVYHRRHLAGRYDVVVEDLNKVPLFTPFWGPAPAVPLVHHLFGRTAFQEASFPVALATVLLEWPLAAAFRGRAAVAVSPSTRDDLVRRGFDRERISVVPNGLDLEVYAPDVTEPRFPEPTLLYLGRLKRYKCVDLILEALARLREGDAPGPRLLIGGKGDDEPRLRRRTSELGLDEAVSFLGFVSEAEKRTLFRRAWVHVLTSPKEGWGITVMEAAACGTPTVASDAPGLRDSVRDGETGLLAPHGDVPALAAALGRLLDDPDVRQRMGAAARSFALGFSWERTADAMEAILVQAAASTLSGGSGRLAPLPPPG